MHIEIACVSCSNPLKLRPEYLGKKVRCPRCNTVFLAEEIPVFTPEMAEEKPLPVLKEIDEVPLLLALEEDAAPPLPVLTEVGEEPVASREAFQLRRPAKATPVEPDPPTPVVLVPAEPPPDPGLRPDERPTPIEVRQPVGRGAHRIYRAFLLPDDIYLIFVGMANADRHLPEARKEQRRRDRLNEIDRKPLGDLLRDNRNNLRIQLDDVTAAEIRRAGFWHRIRYGSRHVAGLLVLWGKPYGKIKIEITSPTDLARVAELLPGSLGKRLRTRLPGIPIAGATGQPPKFA